MEALDEHERFESGNLPRDFVLGVIAVELADEDS